MLFVLLPDTFKNSDRGSFVRLLGIYGAETSCKGRVLFDEAPVFVSCRRADNAYLTSRKHRFQYICRVYCSLCCAGTCNCVYLIYKKYSIPAVSDLIGYRLYPLLKVAAVFCTSDHRRKIETENTHIFKPLRHISCRCTQGDTFGYGGLADTACPDKAGIVLAAAYKYAQSLVYLPVARYHRVEPAFCCKTGKVCPEPVKHAAAVFLIRCICDPAVMGSRGAVTGYLPYIRAQLFEHHCSAAALVPEQSEQDMLGSDKRAALVSRTAQCAFKYLSASWGDIRGGEPCCHTFSDSAFDPAQYLTAADAVLCESGKGGAVFFTEQPIEDMLAPYIGMPHFHCRVYALVERGVCFFGKAFEFDHSVPPEIYLYRIFFSPTGNIFRCLSYIIL